MLTGINATESELSITMHSLLPKNVLRTLQSMITLNNLKKAGIVVSKQVWSKFPLPLDTLIPSIPPETYASDVVEWINTIVLPRITIAELNSYALLLSQQLSKRAIDLEMSSNRLKECLQLVDLSIKLTNSVSITQSQTIYTFVNELKSLQSKFRLLLLLWKEWHQRFSLEDIDSVGLEGLIFDRIDETAETKIVNDVLTNIKPITITENIDLDQLLAKWIEESVRTRIICVKKSITDDDEVCTLSRLLQVLTIITNNTVKAKMILLLFQVSSLDNSESNDLISYLQTENIRRLQEESDVNEEKTRIASVLLQLACSVQEQVDVGYREALTEAIKLLKIRSIASKYNIDSFDSRNVHQLRAALSIIASNQSESAITDAISFAEDWNSDKVDLPSVITNAIIQRIYALNYTMQEGLSSDEIRIRTIFSFIPQNKLHIVIEDCLSYLLETINDNCQLLVDHNTENNDSYCDNLRREIINLTRGAILIVNVSIDSKSNVDNTSDSEGAGRFDSWIDSKILSDLKRLHVLQTEYKVFISTNELLSKDICEKVVENLAKKRVMLLLTDVPTDTNKESWSTTTVITSYYRKACILLNLTAVHFLHVCIGLFTDKGFLVS